MRIGAGPTSVKSERVTALRRLAKRSVRAAEGRFLVEGPQAVATALARGVVQEIWLTQDAAGRYPELVGGAGGAGVRAATVTDAVLRVVTDTVHPAGVIAVVRMVDRPLLDGPDAVLRPGIRLAVVLVEAQDPGNAGTILRTADCAGADAVVTTRGSVDLYNSKAVRATTGSLFNVPVSVDADPQQVLAAGRAAGMRILAAAGGGSTDLYRLAATGGLAGPVMWMFGNEARGLPPQILEAADDVVAIPIFGRAESLNLAGAAAVALMTTAAAQRSLLTPHPPPTPPPARAALCEPHSSL